MLTAHRSQRAEMLTQHDFLLLVQFVLGYAVLFYFVNDLQCQLLGGFAFLRIKCGVDAKKPGSPALGKTLICKREASFFAHALVKPRAAAIANNRREQIERGKRRARHLRMCHAIER